MPIRVAKSAGFCFGVKNAVEAVERAVKSGTKVYTYGEIIHNEVVVEKFSKLGVKVIESVDDIENNVGSVVIRSHGVGLAVYEKLRSKNIEIIDATCPFVKRIQRLVEKESLNKKTVIIIGDEKHPEIQGIIGHCHGEYLVVSSVEEAKKLDLDKEKSLITIVQTTFLLNNFQDIVAILAKKGYYNNDVHNTICDATTNRQRETLELAKVSDFMIVVGGKNSSNTYKLYEIAKANCKNTLLIQDSKGLVNTTLQSKDSIGITAGASTPNIIIEEVHTECLNKALKKC